MRRDSDKRRRRWGSNILRGLAAMIRESEFNPASETAKAHMRADAAHESRTAQTTLDARGVHHAS